MKKSYLYFLAPLIGLAVFGVVYWKYSTGYEARIDAMTKAQQEVRDTKIKADNESKQVAVKEALLSQEKRKQAKIDKETREQKERDDRDRAVQVRGKAKEDARRLVETVGRLKKEVADNKKEIAEIDADKKRLVDEAAFLRDYVKKAEGNRQNLALVLEKIEAADKAAEAAAKAAEAAAKAAKR